MKNIIETRNDYDFTNKISDSFAIQTVKVI